MTPDPFAGLDEIEAGDDLLDLNPHDDPEADDLEPADPPAEDFSDLEDILADAASRDSGRADIARKQRRLKLIQSSTSPQHQDERQALLASIRRLEEGIVWRSTRAVALFQEQHCSTCGGTHRWFEGWMTEQLHMTDPNSRRLLRGKPVERLPEALEVQSRGHCELCSDCVESCLAIDAAAAGGAS